MGLDEEFLQKINEIYGEDGKVILKAFEFAKKKHNGQFRDNGDEYIVHPYETAKILVDMKADIATVVSGFLHDCLEDTDCSENEIAKTFGDEIANIVVGISKTEKIKESRLQNKDENENLRKVLLTLQHDARVCLVKLADRLHNMRTLGVKTRAKQIKIAQETLDLYVPIAERLGMNKFKRELENLCFLYIFPSEYKETELFLEENFKKREKIIVDITNTIKSLATEHNVKNVRVQCRIKSNFSVFLKQQKKGADNIYDIVAHRIIVPDIKDCYTMLGAVHNQWKPVEGRIKDYIAHPKPNLYRSLHTTVLYPTEEGSVPFEIQIRTEEMHNFCEYGVAAHWIYKDRGSKKTSLSGNTKMLGLKNSQAQTDKPKDNEEEFMDVIKTGFYADKIFVFTPRLNVLEMTEGSIAIDAAYTIHSGLGNKCVGAKINGKIVPLDTELKTGDMIEILSSPNSKGPSKDWLKIVKMQSTKDKINTFFRKNMREENIKKGRAILEQTAKTKGVALSSLLNDEWVKEVVDKLAMKDIDDVFMSVGHGSLNSSRVINRLYACYTQNNPETAKPKVFNGDRREKVTNISGLKGIMTKLCKHCTPVPGDNIVGYVSRGRGITIHRSDCKLLEDLEDDRLMEISWDESKANANYTAVIKIFARMSPSILSSITNKFAEYKININYIYSNTTKDGFVVYNIGVEIKNKQELDTFISKLKDLPEIHDIER